MSVTSSRVAGNQGQLHGVVGSEQTRRSVIQSEADLESCEQSKKKSRRCCTRGSRNQWLRNKGAVCVLVWNYLLFTAFYRLNLFDSHIQLFKCRSSNNAVYSVIYLGLSTLLYPVIGWLADSRFGRFKVMTTSLFILWVGLILSVATDLIISTVWSTVDCNLIHVIYIILYVVMTFGFAGCQVTIVQFGIDQLPDASSQELQAFINWYVWTIFAGGVSVLYLSSCVANHYQYIGTFMVALSITVMLCSSFLVKEWLIKEFVKQHVLKKVVRMIRYVIKNKYPRQRSAFTYCEDNLPSRIDLAKDRYGGPFSVEEVEDFKTFLRIIVLAALGSVFCGLLLLTVYDRQRLIYHYSRPAHTLSSVAHCLTQTSVAHLNILLPVILVPLYECVVLPLFSKYIPRINSLKKFVLGMVLALLGNLGDLCLEVIGHYQYEYTTQQNTTLCMFTAKDSLPLAMSLNVSYYWLAIPNVFYGMAVVLLFIAALEFVCAQSPYSMKGLLTGFGYFMLGVSGIVAALVFLPFDFTKQDWSGTSVFSCGFWFFTADSVCALVAMVIFMVSGVCYKWRRRDQDVASYQVFVERFYDREVQH